MEAFTDKNCLIPKMEDKLEESEEETEDKPIVQILNTEQTADWNSKCNKLDQTDAQYQPDLWPRLGIWFSMHTNCKKETLVRKLWKSVNCKGDAEETEYKWGDC